MYIISNGNNRYIGVNNDNVATCVTSLKKALTFSEEKKAHNYLDNLKSTLKQFNWQVEKIKDNNFKEEVEEFQDEVCEYIETELEKSGFDISKFFNETIKTISQLRDYANNMDYLEQEYNKKILDVRHYIRDDRIKLNAIQMQRIGYYLQQLEKERYECKSNHMIAEIFLSDLNRLENISYVDEIRSIKESRYNPRILTYDMLDEISGRRGKIE